MFRDLTRTLKEMQVELDTSKETLTAEQHRVLELNDLVTSKEMQVKECSESLCKIATDSKEAARMFELELAQINQDHSRLLFEHKCCTAEDEIKKLQQQVNSVESMKSELEAEVMALRDQLSSVVVVHASHVAAIQEQLT